MTVRIITDTTACLSKRVLQRYNIPEIPQIIHFGNESYYEGSQMSTAAFILRLSACRDLPKTAAPPPQLFVEEFQRLVPAGDPILCIHPSSEISGTVRSALTAAREFPGADIRVIDTRQISSTLGTLVELAASWAAQGESIETIQHKVEALAKRGTIYFMVSTLEFLARGGRIGGAQAFMGQMLQIKPILVLQNGRVEAFDRERTHKRAVNRLKEIAAQNMDRTGQGYLSVLHADAIAQAEALAEDLKQQLGLEEVPIVDLPPAIITHGGPGLLAVAFFTKES